MKTFKEGLQLLSLVLLAQFGVRSVADCVPAPAGLVGWWRGEGTSDSTGATQGSFRGSVHVVGGKVGDGFAFGGSSSALQLPSSFKLTTTDFSIETWIKRQNATSAGLDAEGGEIFAGSANGFSFGLTHDGRLYGGQIGVISFYSTSQIRDTSWHHVAVTKTGNTVRYFADGNLVTTVSTTATFDLNGPYAIGGLGAPFAGVYYGFLGNIDELTVYSRALSAGEINAIYLADSAGKCTAAPAIVSLPVVNPSFEALTGTDPTFFDTSGKLLEGHYSTFATSQVSASGFYSANAVPGWTGVSGGTSHPSTSVVPGGVTDGKQSAWIYLTGYIAQVLPNRFQADTTYRLTVDVGAEKGFTFPGYYIALYSEGQVVAADTNSVTVPAGTFATAELAVTLPANSPFIGKPIEIRLGIPGSKADQTDFDNVRLTVAPAARVLPVVNPSFEALTGSDLNYFDGNGKLRPNKSSEFPGYPIDLSIQFASADAIPGWAGHASCGTINYTGTPYFSSAIPDGQNVAWINHTGYISQTLAEPYREGFTYRLAVDVGALLGINFTGYTVGLYANGQAVAVDNNSISATKGTFVTANVVITLPSDSSFIGQPIEIRLGIPGSQGDQVVFDNVRLTAQGGAIKDNVALSAVGPVKVQAGTDFTVSFAVKNEGVEPIANVVLNTTLPTGFTLIANTTSQGANIVGASSVQSSLGLLPAATTATVTLTGHGNSTDFLDFIGQVTRDGIDVSLADNQAKVTVKIFGTTVQPPNGIVGWWRAEGDRTDVLGNGNGSSASGLTYVAGEAGQAFNFVGGAPGIIVGNPSAFHLQNFSIETWVKRADVTAGSQAYPYVGGIFSGGLNNYSFALQPTGELAVSQVGVSFVNSSGRITDTAWHHVAVTKNGSSVRFYIDGAPAGTASYNPIFTFETPFAVGSLGALFGYNYTFWGAIDELSLYNRALTGAEISGIYAADASGKSHENITLTASNPVAVLPGVDFATSFLVKNQGASPATGIVISNALPAGFALLETNSATQGFSTNIDGTLVTQIGTLAPGVSATVTFYGHSATPGTLAFHGLVIRDGLDLTLADNEADTSAEILGPCLSAPAGLVALLRGDGNADDVLSHAATFTAPSYAPGRVGQAFNFDGPSEVSIPDSADLDLASFTIETWVYPTTVDGTVDIIASKELYPDALEKIQFEIGIKGPLSDAPSTIPPGNLAIYLSGISSLPNNYGGWVDTHSAIPLN